MSKLFIHLSSSSRRNLQLRNTLVSHLKQLSKDRRASWVKRERAGTNSSQTKRPTSTRQLPETLQPSIAQRWCFTTWQFSLDDDPETAKDLSCIRSLHSIAQGRRPRGTCIYEIGRFTLVWKSHVIYPASLCPFRSRLWTFFSYLRWNRYSFLDPAEEKKDEKRYRKRVMNLSDCFIINVSTTAICNLIDLNDHTRSLEQK